MTEGGRALRDADADATRVATFRKATWRLLPFLGACYLAAYLDRVNVGFAKLQMASQLGLSDAAYGLGAGVFFLGYFLFEVPSNLILHRIGARVWLARIMITWAVISATMAVLGPLHRTWGPQGAEYGFYGLRFLLGLAEAGFFPGVLLYLTYWFPPSRRSFAMALFIMAQPVAFVFGAPLSGLILDRLDGVGGLAGWQWMYLAEAAPALALGLWLPFRLDDRIPAAKWLSADEKALLSQAIQDEAVPDRPVELRELARSSLAWRFALAYFLLTIGAYGLNFWLPSIVNAAGVKGNLAIGLVTAAPYLVAVVVMLSLCARTPAPQVARVRSAMMCVVGGLGLAMSAAFTGQVLLMMTGLALGVSGVLTATALFWSVPSAALDGRAVAAGLAAINALGNLGGFVGPYLMGLLKTRFGDSNPGLYVLAAALAGAGAVLATTRPASSSRSR
jgi:MFS family permease